MTVPHTNGKNATKHIKVSSSGMIKQPLHFSIMYKKWLLKIWRKGSQNICCSYTFQLLIAWTL